MNHQAEHFEKLLKQERAKVAALEAEKEARQQAVPSGWVPLLIEYDPGYPEEVAFGPQIMMDRLKKWLDKYFVMLAAATQPSPAPAAPDVAGLVEALTEILDCPYVLEEATIPRGGVEAAPQQVVGTLHVNLVRMRKARTTLATFHSEG